MEQDHPQSRFVAALSFSRIPNEITRGHCHLTLIERRPDGGAMVQDIGDSEPEVLDSSMYARHILLVPITHETAERMRVAQHNVNTAEGSLFHFYGRREGKIKGEPVSFPESLRVAHPAYVEAFGGALKRSELGIVQAETNCAHYAVQGGRHLFDLPFERLHPKFRDVQNMMGMPTILHDFEAKLATTAMPVKDGLGQAQATLVGTREAKGFYLSSPDKIGIERLLDMRVGAKPLLDHVLETVPVMQPKVQEHRR